MKKKCKGCGKIVELLNFHRHFIGGGCLDDVSSPSSRRKQIKPLTDMKKIKFKILQTPKPGLGNWVAYIRLPDNIKTIDIDEINCHGGITFNSIIKKGDNDYWQKFSPGHWIGWDYAHFGDYLPYERLLGHQSTGKQWQYQEIEAEVKSVIKQIKPLTQKEKVNKK